MALCTHERQLSPSLPREVNADAAAAAAEEEEQAGRMEREMQRRRRSCRECGMSEVRKQQGPREMSKSKPVSRQKPRGTMPVGRMRIQEGNNRNTGLQMACSRG